MRRWLLTLALAMILALAVSIDDSRRPPRPPTFRAGQVCMVVTRADRTEEVYRVGIPQVEVPNQVGMWNPKDGIMRETYAMPGALRSKDIYRVDLRLCDRGQR